MNEPAIGASKARTAKPVAGAFGASAYEMPKMEVPAQVQEMADQGIAHARDAYGKAKVASDNASDLLENALTTAAKAATDYNLKIISIARTNTRAAFDFAHELLGVKSPSEFIELSTVHLRKHFELASAQSKELCSLVQQVAIESAEPIKTSVSKAFSKAS